jgi:hypothetical protein
MIYVHRGIGSLQKPPEADIRRGREPSSLVLVEVACAESGKEKECNAMQHNDKPMISWRVLSKMQVSRSTALRLLFLRLLDDLLWFVV